MGFHESFVVPKISGTDGVNDMTDRLKRRHKDYKRIITMKTLDTSFYREGLPYLVKFHGDEKGKGIDNCDGRVGICIGASGGNLTFVFVSGTFVHEEYNTKVVSISCEYLDNSKIEIIPYWDDIEVTKLIDAVKHDPDKYHGYSYWNEEVELYNQDEIEKESLNDDFKIVIDGKVYPLLIPKYNKDESYEFNMDALKILEDENIMCTFSIKREPISKWENYHGPFRIKVLHNPDGFAMYHSLETDDENGMLKDTWFPSDILPYVKGIHLCSTRLVKDDTEDVEVTLRGWDDITLGLNGASEEITKDVETEPDMKDFYIDDWDKIIDPNVSTKYPLFVRDEHSSDYWIINYDVLCKALCRKDAIFDISFKMKDCRTQAHCSCNAKDVQVHVGGSVLTGKRPGKKDACVHDAVIEFRACDWKMMDFAHVKLRRK